MILEMAGADGLLRPVMLEIAHVRSTKSADPCRVVEIVVGPLLGRSVVNMHFTLVADYNRPASIVDIKGIKRRKAKPRRFGKLLALVEVAELLLDVGRDDEMRISRIKFE
jgi:hypothetical protein